MLIARMAATLSIKCPEAPVLSLVAQNTREGRPRKPARKLLKLSQLPPLSAFLVAKGQRAATTDATGLSPFGR